PFSRSGRQSPTSAAYTSVTLFHGSDLDAGSVSSVRRRVGRGRTADFAKHGDRILFACPKQKRAGGGASTLLYVELELVDQMSFCRLRRAKPTSPAQAITRPGSPAPRIGPGTGVSTGPVLPLGHWGCVAPQRMSAAKMFPLSFPTDVS